MEVETSIQKEPASATDIMVEPVQLDEEVGWDWEMVDIVDALFTEYGHLCCPGPKVFGPMDT